MITTYDYIDANKRKTILLVFLFPISLLVLLFVVLYFALLLNPELKVNSEPILTQIVNCYWPFFLGCILFSTIWTVIAYYEGSSMILKMVNAVKMKDYREIDNETLKRVLEDKSVTKDIPEPQISKIKKILEDISLQAKIPTPNLYIKDEKGLNVFAIGTKENCTIILTKELIETLNESEIETYITRELTHIILEDMRKDAIRILENVSITAGIPTPNLYILENEKGLNAFAVGTNKANCAVILTKGLLETLDKSELEAVIAHEVAHIIHQDTKLMMIVTLLIGFFTYFGYIIVRSLSGGRSSRRSSGKGGGGVIIILLIGLAFLLYGYVVAPLIRLAVSRTREFHADAKSALLTRNPQALISALKKIDKHPIVDTLNSQFNNNELVAPMCIENPLRKKVSLFDSLSNLSSTHPPIDKRIKALQVMDGTNL